MGIKGVAGVAALLALFWLSSASAQTDESGGDGDQAEETAATLSPLVIEGQRDPLFAPEARIERLMRNAPCLGCGGDTIQAQDHWSQRAAEAALKVLDRNLLPQAVPERSAADDPGDDTLNWIHRQDTADRLNRIKAEP